MLKNAGFHNCVHEFTVSIVEFSGKKVQADLYHHNVRSLESKGKRDAAQPIIN